MCDPISLGAAALSAVSAGASYMGNQAAVSAQNQSNQDWEATQRAAAAKTAAANEASRQSAQASLNQSENALSEQQQTQTQQTAATNLNQQMLSGSPAAANSNVQLLGQPTGGADTAVSKDMASRVTDAARQAQGRIAALAGITSYGGGYGDMGTAANTALANSAENINMQADIQKGNDAALGVTQQIQPIAYKPGADIFGSIAGTLAGVAGKAGGTALAKTVAS